MQEFLANGNKIIQQKINDATAQGVNNVVITGNYEISDTIYIPSNITLVLEDCHLRMAKDTFCNMFRNEDLKNQTRDFLSPDTNIRIIGIGRAILDGGEYNGLNERNSLKDGMPYIGNNWLVFFCNVENFEINNIEVRNQRHWAMTFYSSSYGKICNIHVVSDYSRIDEHGNIVYGLRRDLYPQTRIKNSDGIDIRLGCHDILIENITGFSEDDSVAVTALFSQYQKEMNWYDSDSIYNIVIKNIRTAAFCSNVRLLNQGGTKLYNILIDGVMAQENSKYMDGQYEPVVRIGDIRLYGDRHSTKEETYNISVNNIFSGKTSALRLAGEITNCKISNIFGINNSTLIENHAKIYNDEAK